MGLFDWIGRGKREEAWMAQPRRLPTGMSNYADDDGNWIMSHEFANDKDKNIRIYLGARKSSDGKTWHVSLYKSDLKRDTAEDATPNREYDVDITTDPLAVVRTLSEFDRKYRNSKDWVAIDGHRNTYRPFANKYGMHFDDDGNIIKVDKDTHLVKNVFMNRDTLDELFHKAAEKTPEIDTWEEVYQHIVGKWPAAWTVTEEKLVPAKILEAVQPEVKPEDTKAPAAETPSSTAEAKPAETAPAAPETPAAAQPETPPEPKFEKVSVTRPVTLEDLTKHTVYPQFAWEAKQLMEKLKKLPDDLRSNRLTRRDKEALITSLTEPYYLQPDLGVTEVKLAQHLRDTTIVVGLLRAGAELYEDFAKGKFSPDTMALMSSLGRAASNIAQNKLGVPAESAAKIPDIIAKGKDPNGPNLPLEQTFLAYPPAEYKPPAVKPEPPRPPVSKKPPPPAKRRDHYDGGW